MKNRNKKRARLRMQKHAIDRCIERYDIKPRIGSMNRAIKQGRAKLLTEKGDTYEYDVFVKDRWIRCLYSNRMKTVVTILPGRRYKKS